jgi:hypothetical protein
MCSLANRHPTAVCIRCFHLTIKPKPCTQVQGQALIGRYCSAAQSLQNPFVGFDCAVEPSLILLTSSFASAALKEILAASYAARGFCPPPPERRRSGFALMFIVGSLFLRDNLWQIW